MINHFFLIQEQYNICLKFGLKGFRGGGISFTIPSSLLYATVYNPEPGADMVRVGGRTILPCDSSSGGGDTWQHAHIFLCWILKSESTCAVAILYIAFYPYIFCFSLIKMCLSSAFMSIFYSNIL